MNNADDSLNSFLIVSSPILFSKYILQFEVKDFHKEWLNFITNNKYTLLLAPRGSGKSTINTVAFPLWKTIIERKTRVLIVSNTATQAESFGRAIKNYYESDNIERIFGDIKGVPWSPLEMRLQGHGNDKESNITVLGVGGAVLGRHFDLIILDDIADEENMATPLQREKIKIWYRKTLLPSLEPNGELKAVATRFHSDDIYNTFMSDPSFKTKIYDAENYKGKLLWPERLSKEFLAARKSQMGSVLFSMQYKNQIRDEETSIFKEMWFKYYDKLPDDLDFYQGVDLAISEKGDYFVICTVGKDPKSGFYYLADIFYGHYSLSGQFEHIIGKAENYHPIKIAVESNSYQKVVSDELKRNTALPIRALTQFKDKVTRARQLSVLFENGSILFPRKAQWIRELRSELLGFPRGKHDDFVDSLEMATRISQKKEKWDWVKLKESIYAGSYIKKV